MAGDSHGILKRGTITYFPVVPGRLEFAWRLRRYLLEQRPAVIAVELPASLEARYRKALERLYPGKADEVFKLYPAENENEVMDSAQDLASDRFISYGTWQWTDLATKTGGQPTWYYLYTHPRPLPRPVPVPPDAAPKPAPKPSRGGAHSAEIE